MGKDANDREAFKEVKDDLPGDQSVCSLLRLSQQVRRVEFAHYVHSNQERFVAQERERLEMLVAAGVMTAQCAAKKLQAIAVKAASPPPPLPSEQEVTAAKFVTKLLSRQGCEHPDFAALYQRKQELDAVRDASAMEPGL